MVLKELIFNSFYFGTAVVVLKELIFTVDTVGGCGGLELIVVSTLGRSVAILKELILNS